MKETIFNTDIAGQKILVERDFDGSLSQVWKAWTDKDLLAEWWAPKPFKAVTKTMDFREGGHWHYYMLGPDGSQFWCMVNYTLVKPEERFDGDDYFCDEAGTRNHELPGNLWEVKFAPSGSGTRVHVTVKFESKEDLEKIVAMGFKEGFASAHKNLDELLAEKITL